MGYNEEDLKKLHQVLKEICAEIVRVCDENGIEYFIQGGTAMGAHFFNDIMPWDDDMDLGMTMDNYRKFIELAPQKLRKGFSLQVFETEPDTPFYFAKVRKDDTLFVEELYRNLNIHHGIYVDIFPYGKVPDCHIGEVVQREQVRFLINCFISKTIWVWRRLAKHPEECMFDKSLLSCLLIKCYSALFSKRQLYRQMMRAMSRHDKGKHKYYNIVRMPKDQIEVEAIKHPVMAEIGSLKVKCPANVEGYLRHHYGQNIQKWPAPHLRVNHAPMILRFNAEEE